MILIWGGNSLDTRTIDPKIEFIQFEGRKDRDLNKAIEMISKGSIKKVVIYTKFCSHAQSAPLKRAAQNAKIDWEFVSTLASYRKKKSHESC